MAEIKLLNDELLLSTVGDNYEVLLEEKGLQTNFTGGVKFLTAEYDGLELTTTSATEHVVLVLPDVTSGFTLSISGNTVDIPVSVIYLTGNTTHQTNSKNYIYGSGETIGVTHPTNTEWSFGAETVYNRVETDDYLVATGSGVGGPTRQPLSMSGKWTLAGTETTGLTLSTDYLQTLGTELDTGADTGTLFDHKFISADGKRIVVSSTDGASGDGYIRYSTDGGANFSQGPYVNNVSIPYTKGQIVGKYAAFISGVTYVYSDDDMVTWNKKTISGAGTLISICMNQSGQIMYANEATKIWRSIDYGATWTAVQTGGYTQTGVACSASGQHILSSASSSTGSYNFYSGNFGISWSTRNSEEGFCAYSSHSGKYQGFIGDGNAYAHVWSTNFGGAWTSIGQGPIWNTRGGNISINADGTYAMTGNVGGVNSPLKEKEGGF